MTRYSILKQHNNAQVLNRVAHNIYSASKAKPRDTHKEADTIATREEGQKDA